MTVISERFRCGSWCQVRLEDILGIAQSRCPKDPGDGVTGQKKYGNVMNVILLYMPPKLESIVNKAGI